MSLNRIHAWISPYLGCDPEFFFANAEGQTIGAEKIVPKTGLRSSEYNLAKPLVVLDGVQAEFNPPPGTCRQSMGSYISSSFQAVKSAIAKNPGIGTADFSSVVRLSQGELDSLSAAAKVFGCAPSKNVDGTPAAKLGKVDPATYKIRAAGGHIHLGTKSYKFDEKDHAQLVNLLDLILASPMVMVDRDPLQRIRRETYGQAGEYREPAHGLEYRTLSNFWLRSYQMMSGVFSIARLAASLVYYEKMGINGPWESTTVASDPYASLLLKQVPRADVVNAINQNDPDMAMKNWERIESLLYEMLPTNAVTNGFPLGQDRAKEFRYFLNRPLTEWWPNDPMKHWTESFSTAHGWESFLSYVVPRAIDAERVKQAVLSASEAPRG